MKTKERLSEVPENIKEKLNIKLISTIDEALGFALTKKPVAIEWDEKRMVGRAKKRKY